MSSGACRALVAVLLTLIATATLALPVGAATDGLVEESLTTYTVDPASGKIDVKITLTLRNDSDRAVGLGEWGPVYVEEVADPIFSNSAIDRSEFTALPGLWKSMQLLIPRIEGGGSRLRTQISYTIDAPISSNSSSNARTPARVGEGYVYFCVPGQDTDTGSIRIELPARFDTTQSGSPLEENDQGLQSADSTDPVELFTCVEGTNQRLLASDRFAGPGGREIVLQAWPESAQWLTPARTNVATALDDIGAFLGYDIPGEGPVTIRQAPPRSLGGYASAHDTFGIVQMDEAAGQEPNTRNHEVAHVWFGTNNFVEQWLREGLASWTASSMAGQPCAAVEPGETSLDLSAWQVIRPTAPANVEELIVQQEAAACGLVSAVADRLDDETWRAVLGSMLNGEAKYLGRDGVGSAPTAAVDYREWLDAVDERGLIPAGYTDLDFAQDLLADFGVTPDPLLLLKRSETRARYHQFLADAAPMAAPAVVRAAMDNWFFDDANTALDKSYEVLTALRGADSLLPEAGLVPFIQPGFENAQSTAELDEVRAQAEILLDSAEEIIPPLTTLREVSPVDWGLPTAVRGAITEQRFSEVMSAITPAIEVVKAVSAADGALPQAGLLEAYRPRYEASESATQLEELAAAARQDRDLAEQAGIALSALDDEVGRGEDHWVIPAAVLDPVENGQLSDAIAVIESARGVVRAARQADIALPEADLGADIRTQFEAVTSATEMAALRVQAEGTRDEARSVGSAFNSLRSLVPGWQIPKVLSDPVDARDFTTAALSAAAAQKWIQNAWQADQNLPQIQALDRTRTAFESATTMADLRAGGALAANWANASARVADAVRVEGEERSLLTDLGLWGTDVRPALDAAIAAAIAGDVPLATAKSAEVIEVIRGGSGAGGLRLAGVVLFGIAVIGVLGLWWLFRAEAGPSWARQTKPHWLDDGKARRDRNKKRS